MSSMRNAVSRRNHKERSQPKAREKWGILEKHKDYALRARDYNLKKAKVAALSNKARNKNQDEFAFGMLSATKAQAGKHGRGEVQANRLSHDAVKLLKSQDAGYLRVVAGRGRRELDRLEQMVGMDGGMQKGTKVVFVEEEKFDSDTVEKSAPTRRRIDTETTMDDAMDDFNLAQGDESVFTTLDTAMSSDNVNPHTTKANAPKSKKVLIAERKGLQDLRTSRKRRKRLAELRAAKLEALKKRQREILAAADELELQRAKMARTVGGVTKEGVKWKIRERKR